MARPTKFTDAVRDKVLEGLRAGFTRSAAAGTAGVHPAQIGRWCTASASFATDCVIAEAQAEARFTLVVTKAAQDGDPKIALEWLKRRRRDEWGDNLSLSRLSDEDVIALATGGVPGTDKAGDTAG